MALLTLGVAFAQPAPPPVTVQLVTQGDEPGLVRAANQLRTMLAELAGLSIAPDIAVGRLAAQDLDSFSTETKRRLDAASAAYTALKPEVALAELSRAKQTLHAQMDRGVARPLLARALRLEGLTRLFMDEKQEGMRAFLSAAHLDPQFSPAAEEWPPNARLAYADTVASLRRAEAGALSLHVEPKAAQVWLDGESLGLGSTTVHDLAPGDHFLLVTCPGHRDFSGVVTVEGNRRLNQSTVFLVADAANERFDAAATTLIAALRATNETMTARQVATLLDMDALVVVGPDPAGQADSYVAWIFDKEGERRGGHIGLSSANAAAIEIEDRILGRATPMQGGAAKPWYKSWQTWAAAGAVVAVVSVVVVVSMSLSREDRVDFNLGRGP